MAYIRHDKDNNPVNPQPGSTTHSALGGGSGWTEVSYKNFNSDYESHDYLNADRTPGTFQARNFNNSTRTPAAYQRYDRNNVRILFLSFLEYLTTSITSITLKSTGTVDYEVDWGDGNTESSTTNNLTHNYSSSGEYTIKITPAEGSTYRPRFNGVSGSGGEEDKIVEVDGTGGASLAGFLSYAWSGSTSLTSFSGNIDFSNVTGLLRCWQYCPNLTSFPFIDTSSVTYISSAWQNCTALTTFPLIDTSNATTINGIFQGCSGLTEVPAIDLSSATSLFGTFSGCSSITSIPQFDLSSATNITVFCNSCTNLVDVPVLTFNSALQYASSAFNGCALSAQSIENILVAWDNCGALNVSTNIDGGTSAAQSTWSAAANNAYNSLISKGWTITHN